MSMKEILKNLELLYHESLLNFAPLHKKSNQTFPHIFPKTR